MISEETFIMFNVFLGIGIVIACILSYLIGYGVGRTEGFKYGVVAGKFLRKGNSTNGFTTT